MFDFVTDNIGTIAGGVGGFMLGGPVGAGIGMSLGGGMDAGRASGRASEAANEQQWKMYQQGREDTAPWREFSAGNLGNYGNAIRGLEDYSFDFDPSQVENTPGYQFRLEQGSENMMRGMRASGMRQSGGMAVDMMQYGQNYASQEYQNEYQRQLQSSMANYGFQSDNANRYAAAAGMGQTSANQGAVTAANVGQSMAGYSAAGIMGQNNAWAGGINSALNVAGNAGWFDGSQTPGGVGTPPYFPTGGGGPGYGPGMGSVYG